MIAVVMLAACCARVDAGGLVITTGSPRAIGRAGVGTVGDDGGGALLVNPAAMARRDAKRAQVGIAFIDDSVEWTPTDTAPRAHDQAASSIVPMVAVEGGLGEWIVGVGAMTSAVSERALPSPAALPADQLANRFEYRYAGIAGAIRRDTVTAGVAHRLGDAVAIGVSLAGSRVSLSETRSLWPGFSGVAMPGDAASALDLAITADTFAPSAVVGVLVAPPDTRVELAASIGWAGMAHVSGQVVPIGEGSNVHVETGSASARLDLHQPVTLRTGARWLGQRWIVELDGDLWIFATAAEQASWQLGGIHIVDASGVAVDLHTLPSRVSARTHGALRAAIDGELVAGFLWATAGYAYTTAGTASARLSPTFGDLAGHTLGLGLEANAGGFTITLGWARTWSIAQSVPNSLWRLDNPFAAGDAPVAPGRYDGSSDMVGIAIDGELDTQ